jgi:tRNA 5-methylaminomethyl-2-thiouridine biosynthesis bifunctional protein
LTSRINQARLQWDEADLPFSLDYGDIYFSRADALGESSHVFLAGNRLQERWQQLDSAAFIIGETGFGTGLNFLNACRLWAEATDGKATLHYISCELHPIAREDLVRWHARFPQLADWSRALLRQYTGNTAGVQQMELQVGRHRVILTLLLGDANAMFSALGEGRDFRVDAWFLDGFAPRLNPALWQTALLRTLATLSHGGTTLATYSVAGSIRQALQDAGFIPEKIPGFASKKEMLVARLSPATAELPTRVPNTTVCIVGGGLAGCSTAFALARQGIPIILLEQADGLATMGSGNPQGILHFRPVKRLAPDHHFNLLAYLHASRYYQSQSDALGLEWHGCGHLQLAHDDKQARRFRDIIAEQQYADGLLQWVDAAAASSIAGIRLDTGGLFFPDSGWISPPALCRFYTNHPLIDVRNAHQVLAMEQVASGWRLQVQTPGGLEQHDFRQVVLCNSADVHAFIQTRHLPVISNRGQVDVYATAPDEPVPKTVVCGQSYLVPADHGIQSTGGSYFLGDHSSTAQSARQAWHLDRMADVSIALADKLRASPLVSQRTGTRSITPDRLPLAGSMAATPGLYLNCGHGSHGLTRTPFCAALLASRICRTPPPMQQLHSDMLAPDRYGKGKDSAAG